MDPVIVIIQWHFQQDILSSMSHCFPCLPRNSPSVIWSPQLLFVQHFIFCGLEGIFLLSIQDTCLCYHTHNFTNVLYCFFYLQVLFLSWFKILPLLLYVLILHRFRVSLKYLVEKARHWCDWFVARIWLRNQRRLQCQRSIVLQWCSAKYWNSWAS